MTWSSRQFGKPCATDRVENALPAEVSEAWLFPVDDGPERRIPLLR